MEDKSAMFSNLSVAERSIYYSNLRSSNRRLRHLVKSGGRNTVNSCFLVKLQRFADHSCGTRFGKAEVVPGLVRGYRGMRCHAAGILSGRSDARMAQNMRMSIHVLCWWLTQQ